MFIQSWAGDVYLFGGATGTLGMFAPGWKVTRHCADGSVELGATVLAQAQATPTATSTITELTSIGMRDTYTIFLARRAPSNVVRRRALPRPTCSSSMTDCSNLRGAYACVDTQTDLFSEASPRNVRLVTTNIQTAVGGR